MTVASQGLDGAPRGTEVLLQLTRILVCILFLQHAVMQKPRLVFKQLVYVTANTSQKQHTQRGSGFQSTLELAAGWQGEVGLWL